MGVGHEGSWDGGGMGRAAGRGWGGVGRGWGTIKLRGAGQDLQPAHSLSLPLP